VDWIDGTVTMT